MAKQKTYGKFRKRELIQVPLNDPIQTCKRNRLSMIWKSNPQLRLPEWADAVRFQQGVGKIAVRKDTS